jgi:hypothetical protein
MENQEIGGEKVGVGGREWYETMPKLSEKNIQKNYHKWKNEENLRALLINQKKLKNMV